VRREHRRRIGKCRWCPRPTISVTRPVRLLFSVTKPHALGALAMGRDVVFQEGQTHQEPDASRKQRFKETHKSQRSGRSEWQPTVAFHRAPQVIACPRRCWVAIIVSRFGSAWFLWPAQNWSAKNVFKAAPIVQSSGAGPIPIDKRQEFFKGRGYRKRRRSRHHDRGPLGGRGQKIADIAARFANRDCPGGLKAQYSSDPAGGARAAPVLKRFPPGKKRKG